MDKNKKCPKCGGEFEEGFVADKYSQTGAISKPQWGTKTMLGFIGLKSAHKVKTYRCKSCGYLESYAE
jgi:predicted nucleic-acid-binding Zn-ribbon protein